MTQLNKTRAGSQSSGTANEYDAPIKQNIPGMKFKQYVADDSDRHADMFPKQQDAIIRPFWLRTAGTGYREWMESNQLAPPQPLQRTPPPDPYQGSEVGTPDTSGMTGWTDEDVLPYV
jgi:hypothetical protein